MRVAGPTPRWTALIPWSVGGLLAAVLAWSTVAGTDTHPRSATPPASTATAADTPTPAPSLHRDRHPDPLAPTIRWHGCGADAALSVTLDDRMPRCGTVVVPIDPTTPAHGTETLSVRLLPATGPSPRVLFLNVGGPGAAASPVLAEMERENAIPSSLRQAYDIVALDPRGAGDHSWLRCGSPLLDGLDVIPQTPGRWLAAQEAAHEFATSCRAVAPELAAHMSSSAQAADLDLLRRSLGVTDVDVLAYSYGTYLAYRQAQLHPGTIRRMVLDGPVDPGASADARTLQQARALTSALDELAYVCVHDFDTCPLGTTEAGVRAALLAWARQIDAAPPASTSGPRSVVGSFGGTGLLVESLIEGGSWEDLVAAIADSRSGTDEGLLALMRDLDLEAHPDITSLDAANQATRCSDGERLTVDQALRVAGRGPAPFAAYLAQFSLGCDAWPRDATPVTPLAKGPSVLVITNDLDPSTPRAAARPLADLFARSALVEVDLIGHTASLLGIACVDDAVTTFLLRGEVEGDVRRCD